MGEQNNSSSVTTKEEIKKQKKLGIIIAVVLVLAAIIAGAWLAVSNTPTNLAKEQISLGNNYLVEENYEQAIVAFTQAIEIDPSIEEAYFGLAEVYVAQKDYDSAKGILEQGFAAIQDEEFKTKLEEVEVREKEERNAEIVASFPEGTKELCEQIIAAYQSEDYLGACELSKLLLESIESKWSSITDDVVLIETANGTVGIYCYYKDEIEDFGIYCGDYLDGIREGKGILMFPGDELRSYYAIGEWKEDKPNGWQSSCYNPGNSTSSVFPSTAGVFSSTQEISGNVVDGLWHGEVSYVKTDYLNAQLKEKITSTLNFENGIIQILQYGYNEDNVHLVAYATSYWNGVERKGVFCKDDYTIKWFIKKLHGIRGYSEDKDAPTLGFGLIE